MKKILIITTVLGLYVLLNSCKNNGTGPNPDVRKSVRDYTWTADTIFYEGSIQTLMSSIWGSGPNDIYICGHSDDSRGQLWHYDGTGWSNVDIFKTVPHTPFTPYEIHGTSSNNVFIAGAKLHSNPNPPPNFLYQSFIVQYDGSRWIEHNVNTKSAVQSVYSVTPTDVWACGGEGIVYHYDGSKWDLDTIKISKTNEDTFQLNRIIKYGNQIYILGRNSTKIDPKKIYYFFENSDKGWTKVDSFIIQGSNIISKWGSTGFYITSYNKLYSYGFGGVFEKEGSNWNNIFHVDYPITDMTDNGQNNILISGDFGNVFHYDGESWKLLDELYNQNILYTGLWLKDNEAFIIGYTLDGWPMKTVVLHGK